VTDGHALRLQDPVVVVDPLLRLDRVYEREGERADTELRGELDGLSVGETTLGTTVGNLGFEKVEFPKPVFIGDTIRAETEVVEKRDSKSRPEWGIVLFEHRGVNQRGEVVAVCRRAAMMLKKRPG